MSAVIESPHTGTLSKQGLVPPPPGTAGPPCERCTSCPFEITAPPHCERNAGVTSIAPRVTDRQVADVREQNRSRRDGPVHIVMDQSRRDGPVQT
ncbi:hypothetical protein EYF80_047214 [Liparis tanakae]|uniref:Uncharacterized protein n=1 Tax=Liparis tanakae TaxID=230148 RepID=A0A4Z2FQG9_9TELE|nr:hypothetical protein EYF80_047214 [Liparis tanakae]